MYRYKGFDPTRNQSEFGTPQESPTGDTLKFTRLVGYPTVLPFHFMTFKNQVGGVAVGSYVTVSPVPNDMGYEGQVPLKMAPVFSRPKPWLRKETT
jgi:hypothetical protein